MKVNNVIEDRVLDARGLMCPMPVVKASRELMLMQPGQVLKVIASDRAARTDFPAWVEDVGHQLLRSGQESNGTLVFYVRKREESE